MNLSFGQICTSQNPRGNTGRDLGDYFNMHQDLKQTFVNCFFEVSLHLLWCHLHVSHHTKQCFNLTQISLAVPYAL